MRSGEGERGEELGGRGKKLFELLLGLEAALRN